MTKFLKFRSYNDMMDTTKGMTEDDLFHMLNAYILGDGSIQFASKTNKNALFTFGRTAIHEYSFFKIAAIIERITPGVNINLIEAKTRTTKDGVVINSKDFWVLQSPSSPIYTMLRDAFYPNGVKVVPHEVAKQIDLRTVASMYEADGYLKSRDGYAMVCTDGFTLEDVQTLQKAFTEATNLPWSIQARASEYSSEGYRKSDGGRKYRLYLARKHTGEFFDQISPLVHETFRYKLDRSKCN